MVDMLTPPPLSLYVHLPWCVRKCPYCDFNSHEFRGAGGTPPFTQYVEALLANLDHDLPLAWGRTVHSVFFGGGTPSLFPAEAIDAFLQGASARLRFAPGLEVTLETNPGTAEHGRFEHYLAAGVNRLSFGVQTFDDAVLQRLGRIHDSAEADAAVKLARDAGYDNFNLDLMYALPGQTLAMAERDIERALALPPAHVSHYQLTLEPNTAFAAGPPPGIPAEDAARALPEPGPAMRAEADAAVKLARDAGYDNVNLDLMYALPGQTLAMAERDIERALALQPAHVSHYQLTLEPNTVFAAGPPPGIPDEDAAWDMQERCQAMLADAGYAQYEVSAYARPGLQCAHNLNYWRFGDYLGIGAGAHGKLTLGAEQAIVRRWKHKPPTAYLALSGPPPPTGRTEDRRGGQQ